MSDEDTLVSDVMATPEQVLAAGGVSKRRRGASRRSPSGQRRRAPTPEPPKDLPIDPEEELELKSEKSPTKPTTVIKRISTTDKTLVTKRSHSAPGEGRQSSTSSTISSATETEPIRKTEEQGVQAVQKTTQISPSRNVVVIRKSTAEKTLAAKRSQSQPADGRQPLPQSVTTGNLKEEVVAAPRRRRLSDDAEKILSDNSDVLIVRKTIPAFTQIPSTEVKAKVEDTVEVKTSVDEERKTEDIKSVLSVEPKAPEEIIPIKKTVDNVQPPVDDKDKTITPEVISLSTKTSTPPIASELKEPATPTEDLKKHVTPSEVSVPEKAVEESSKIDTTKSTETQGDLKEELDKPLDEHSPEISVAAEQQPKEAVWGPFFKEAHQEWKKFKSEHPDQWGKIKAQRNRCIGALLVMIIYCGIGGLIFRFTEGAFEAFYKCGVKRVKRDFVDSLWLGSHHLLEDEWKSQARKKLMELETQLHAAHDAGVTTYSGQRAWSFLNAVVYCLTVVTTIGYGHISPSTTTGRAITIVYAIFGIPMFLILLADFGKLFTRGIKFIWAFVRRVYYTGSCKKVRRTGPVQEVMKGVQLVYDFATFRRPSQMMGEGEEDYRKAPIARPEDLELQVPLNPPQQQLHQTQQQHHQIQQQHHQTQQQLHQTQQQHHQTQPITLPIDGHDGPGTPALSTYEVDDEFNLPISVAIVILLIYIFVGATIYWTWEQWGFFESFYFVFISMSTIGFGDFVPQHPMYMMASIVYLVFGLALTSMCINVVQEKLSDSFRQASAKLGATIGLRVNEEDGTITPIPPPQIELPEVHRSIPKSRST